MPDALDVLGWNDPDPAILDELTRWATFGADSVAIALIGSPLTEHERTTQIVRASLRLLLANGLIQPTIPDDEIMVVMDPPGGWSLPRASSIPPPPRR